MRLRSLDVSNFRPYYGHVTLDFPDEVPGELFLIHGPNGFGKTSLHMAVQWALYGESGRRELYDNANMKARREPGEFKMSVSLTFTHEDHEYQVVREARGKRETIEAPDHLSRSELSLYRDGTPVAREQEVAQERVEHIVPRDASQFFFFDGEKIGRYSSTAHTDETRAAIELVLGLRAAQNARDDAAKLKAEVRRERNKALERSDQHVQLIDKQETLESEIEKLTEELETVEARLRENEDKRSQYWGQLDELQEVQSLAERRDGLRDKKDEVVSARDQVIEELKKESRGLYLRVLAPKVAEAHDECKALYERLREQETGRRLDEAVRDYLEKLERQEMCVCGRPLDDEHRTSIEQAVANIRTPTEEGEESASERLPEVASRLEQLRKAQQSAENAAQRFDELKVRKVDLDERLSEVDSALAQVENQIRSIDVESVNSLRNLIEELDNEIRLDDQERVGLEHRIEQRREELAELDKKIGKVGSASSTVAALGEQLDLLTRTENAFDEYLVRCAQARREQIEEEANRFFKQLTNKDFGYESMFIGEDFTFHIRASDGTTPNMDQISAGEKQVVAFSFIMGLNQYAKAMAPLMIDTPMGRLDTIHRRNLADALAGLSQQVFLFVTDTDLGFGVEEIFRERLEKEFEIKHNQKELTSTIVEREADR